MINQRTCLLFIFCALVAVVTVSNGADCLAKPTKKTESAASAVQNNVQDGAMGIVAVVGDQAISSFDVNSRIKFIIATTRISNTPEMLANIRPQIIHTLIDESLQMQEAAKNNITISDKEVVQAIANIEAQRGMPSGGVANMLAASHVPEKTFNDQIRAQLAWSKLLGKTVRPRIKISDEEVALAQGYTTSDATEKTSANTIKEIEIAVINLPIDKPQREAELKKLSEKLYGELRKGASFEEVARQFSANGDGKSFWIRPEQLDHNIAQSINVTKEGAITAPIRTHDGFSIIKLLHVRTNKNAKKNDKHDVEITLKEILLKLKPTADTKEADVLLQIGEEISKNPGKCEDKGVAGVSGLDNFDIEVNMRKAPFSELPPALRSISDSMKLGDMSTPFASAEGIRLYMLCGKNDVVGLPHNTDKIRESLFRQKFELEAQKYLRDLQRGAFIEVRG